MLKKLRLNKVHDLMKNDYALLTDLGVALNDGKERALLSSFVFSVYQDQEKAPCLAASCQCFYLFLRFHSLDRDGNRKHILLGDYFFSRFMELLVASGHIGLLDYFSTYVTEKSQEKDIDKEFSLGEFLPFLSFVLREAGKEKETQKEIVYTPSLYAKKIVRPAGMNR